MSYKDKVVRCVRVNDKRGNFRAGIVDSFSITFTDGCEIRVLPCNEAGRKVMVYLIEPTLNSDVIPIGANTLGEGSI